jgi:hypothetical protein
MRSFLPASSHDERCVNGVRLIERQQEVALSPAFQSADGLSGFRFDVGSMASNMMMGR